MANKSDVIRNGFRLTGPLAKRGYDWWWHNMTAINKETGEEKPFFIEFFVCNPALAKDKPNIVWNRPEAQKAGERPSYVMVKVGFWGEKEKGQIHNFYAWKDAEIAKEGPIDIKVNGCHCSEKHISGKVKVTPEEAAEHPEWMSDAGEMSWDLTVDKNITYNVGYGASKFFRKINSFEMFWHAEGIRTFYKGTITLNGVEYSVEPETCYGYADKNWGGDFTEPWVWLSSSNLTSRISGKKLLNSVFEIGGGKPKVFGVALDRKLLGCCWYEGEDFEFNFSKFWTLSTTKFDCYETDDEIVWHVEQSTVKGKMITDIRCYKKDMIYINYECPDGLKRYNHLNNGGNGTGVIKLYRRKGLRKYDLIDEMDTRNVGCEYGVYDF
ncbi:MAG: hypothetical protein HUJ66_00965 [Oscillospiraceae bacterium]|nr:hypothetical protein [Oscillospiraceae bacterium]